MLIQRHLGRQPAAVAQSWARIEKCLAIHLPEVLADLRPGVGEEHIEQLEAAIGQRLPDDVRESWRIHDGQEGFRSFGSGAYGVAFGSPLLPLVDRNNHSVWGSWMAWAEIADTEMTSDSMAILTEECSSFPIDAIRCRYAHRAWIPLHDWDGNCFGVDLDPGPNGVVGQIISFGKNHEAKHVLAQSWAHFLEDIADELENDNFVADRQDGLVIELRYPKKEAFCNLYQEWSEAKLPLDFQRAQKVPLPVPPLADAATSAACVARLREFIETMVRYELHWLGIRSLKSLGLSFLAESEYGFMAHGLPASTPSVETCSVTTADFQTLHNTTQERMQRERERLQVGRFAPEAVSQKKVILEQYATTRPRSVDFIQMEPPAYSPELLQVAEVRQETRDEVVVVMQPTERVKYGQVQRITVRFRMKKEGTSWRVDAREESGDKGVFAREPL